MWPKQCVRPLQLTEINWRWHVIEKSSHPVPIESWDAPCKLQSYYKTRQKTATREQNFVGACNKCGFEGASIKQAARNSKLNYETLRPAVRRSGIDESTMQGEQVGAYSSTIVHSLFLCLTHISNFRRFSVLHKRRLSENICWKHPKSSTD